MKTLRGVIAILTFVAASFGIHAAEYVNDVKCTLNEGFSVPQLFAFQKEWMAAAREQGFDEGYRTEILFPVYNDNTANNPLFFLWRGYFKDGTQWGKLSDWSLSNQEWATKFPAIMNCSSASLWTKP